MILNLNKPIHNLSGEVMAGEPCSKSMAIILANHKDGNPERLIQLAKELLSQGETSVSDSEFEELLYLVKSNSSVSALVKVSLISAFDLCRKENEVDVEAELDIPSLDIVQ
jgi:hypothetical protein